MSYRENQPLQMIGLPAGHSALEPTTNGWNVSHIVALVVVEEVTIDNYGAEVEGPEPGWRGTSIGAVVIDPELGPIVLDEQFITHWLAPGDDVPDAEQCAEEWAQRQAAARLRRERAEAAQSAKVTPRPRPPAAAKTSPAVGTPDSPPAAPTSPPVGVDDVRPRLCAPRRDRQ